MNERNLTGSSWFYDTCFCSSLFILFVHELNTIPGRAIRLTFFRGYKLSKQEHILALQSDYDLITEALRFLAQWHVGSVRGYFLERFEGGD